MTNRQTPSKETLTLEDQEAVVLDTWEDLPIYSSPGTVGVKLYGDESGREQIRKAALDYLERAGLATSELASPPVGASSTGGPLDGIYSIIVDTGSLIADAAGIATATIGISKYIHKELQRRDQERRAEGLPEVSIHLDDNRGQQADAIQLIQVLSGLETHLASEHPHRRYSFFLASSTQVIKTVVLKVKAGELQPSTERALVKHLKQNGHADSIVLEPLRDKTGRIYISAYPYPPKPKIEPRQISLHPLQL